MNTRTKNFIAIAAFSLLTLGIPTIASAQYGGGYGQTGGVYGNRGYSDMRSIVRDLKSRAGEFQKELDRELDHSRYNGSRREDNINQIAKDFHNAAKRLNENAAYNGQYDPNMNEVLSLGNQIERTISRTGLSYGVQNVWSGIRYDLQALGGSNNGRGNRGYGNGNQGQWPH